MQQKSPQNPILNPMQQDQMQQKQMQNPMQHLMQQNFMGGASQPTPEDPLEGLSMLEDPDDDLDLEEACAQASIQQILEHNCALRQNFEELKDLHLQLTDANLQLHEARLRLQQEKEALEKALEKASEKASTDATSFKIEKERLQEALEKALEKASTDATEFKIEKERLLSTIDDLVYLVDYILSASIQEELEQV
ncbi:hypothetical protein KC19_4G170300 [Ceratodon purpureus]|uniref:Uncharacterized protein n=1 Tax=Ceratodon purpureus TaxID=3225 RepID=A0A8T0I9E8_CERPU|nr:hypothetical protein KC19_4G170300 [Ceratodon purpureus]